MDSAKLWNSVLIEMELALSKANFNTWFKDTAIVKLQDGVVYVGVPNAFVKEWLATKYHSFILKSLRNLSENIRALEYSVTRGDVKRIPTISFEKINPSINRELPLNDFYINKEDNLNPRYTFESFVVGPFNELAHAAAQAIIKKPGIAYNPLFVYGNTGNGKTHLIQAVGNHLKNALSLKKIYYITSEKFAVDYINCIGDKKMSHFKEKYQKYDVFIMDDIQFLSNKNKTQEELFHLFNNLYDNNKQIIFSSDKHPNYIPGLEDRLKSRFGAGMIVEVTPPEHESRAAILRAKAAQSTFAITDDLVDYLASTTKSNIREIEGILNAVVCQSQLKGEAVGLVEVKNLIKNNVKPKKILPPQEIVRVVASFYNIKEENITEKSRRKEVIIPRQVAMYILRQDYNISYPSIGQKLGGRDHTTVIHSYEKIKNEIKAGGRLAQEIEEIRATLV